MRRQAGRGQVSEPRIYPFSKWALLGPALAFWPFGMILALNLYESADPAAARVGAILLPLVGIVLVLLAAAALLYKPHLSVSERALTMKLPFNTRTYAWDDIGDVSLEETSRHPMIRIQMRDGATKAIPIGLIDPLGAYASIHARHETARSA
jgi:hypothetical protein